MSHTAYALSPSHDWNRSTGWKISTQGDVQWSHYLTAQDERAVQLTLTGECDVTIDFCRPVHDLSLDTQICRFGRQVVHAYWLTFFDGDNVFVPSPTQFGHHLHERSSPLCSLTLSTGPHSTVHLRALRWSPLRLH
ncbi:MULTISPECIES: hypothetical protein [Pseudomonas]|uniref:Uncharacterized protein n=1 Tax=Pseudomonas muyukensis TaxID=2842357 RepID=A0ABX8MB32_9PSED|nr:MULTISPECIES: hypothetical protein [Pseudomonas]MCO7522161.1 hypothetical protein [Pseudomonas sp. 1]MCO7539760.1 hypothetical protein [Pseudomonas sp. VA159-2]QXH36213.1 hypothetical protein KSS95_05115 [Pseudomonas muyukensis]